MLTSALWRGLSAPIVEDAHKTPERKQCKHSETEVVKKDVEKLAEGRRYRDRNAENEQAKNRRAGCLRPLNPIHVQCLPWPQAVGDD